MSYLDLLSQEGVESQFLAIIKPRYRINNFVLISGTKFSATFELGRIILALEDSTTLTEASSSDLSDGNWFYDNATKVFYIDINEDLEDPLYYNYHFIIVNYEIYLSTFDAHWYRIPNDDTSDQVYFEPIIERSPIFFSSVSDSIIGFQPSQSSTIVISNATHLLQEHVYASSFNQCDIEIWNWLDKLKIENIYLSFKGICGDITNDDKSLSITIYDSNFIFKNEFRHKNGGNFFFEINNSGYISMNSDDLLKPIKKVIGYIEKYQPVVLDYSSNRYANTFNRYWCVGKTETGTSSVLSTTVTNAGTNTTTRTYVSSVVGFNINDDIWIQNTSPSFSGSVIISAIGANYLDHTALASAAPVGGTVSRNNVFNIRILQGKKTLGGSVTEFRPLFGKHYFSHIDITFNRYIFGIQFSTTMESNLVMNGFSPETDEVICSVYGEKNFTTLNGNPFGSNSTTTGTLTNGAVILYDIFKTNLGFQESQLNLTSFQGLETDRDDELGFTIPFGADTSFPTYSDLMVRFSQTLLIKIFQDFEQKWSVKAIGPADAPSKTLEDDEILIDSFSHNFNFSDIYSDIRLTYARNDFDALDFPNETFKNISSTNYYALHFHRISKQKEITSFHFRDDQAAILANRLSLLFGDRAGRIALNAPNRFYDSLIGDTIQINRTRLAGFPYDAKILRGLDASIISTTKSLNNVTLELDDQKAINDHVDEW